MGLFSKLAKLAIHTATIPVDAVRDIVTLGGAITDKDQPYLVDKVDKMLDDVDEINDEVDKL